MDAKILLALLICYSLFSSGQNDVGGYTRDKSDWWSILNENFIESKLKPRNVLIAEGSFRIDGVELGEDQFRQLEAKFGKAPLIERGDASTGRSQACYVLTNKMARSYLILEKGEVDYSLYLFTGGRNWNGSNRCVKANFGSYPVRTSNGLRLGLSRTQIERILGIPDSSTADKLIYVREIPKRASVEDLARMRKEHPEMGDKEFHQNYDFYTLSEYLEARLVGSSVDYIVVSKSEVY